MALGEGLSNFWRDWNFFEITQARRKMAGYAVLFCECEQTRPIHGRKRVSKPLTIARRRGTLEQHGPFALERDDAR